MLPSVVTVIVPCRNEREHIVPFCQSAARQQLPEGWLLEVLVADGLSDDGTRDRLSDFCQQDPRFRMIDNPGRIVSTGLNRCIAESQGCFIVRMDVHTVYAPDYVAECLSAWQRTGADNVGGPWRAAGQDGPDAALQRAVAAAFQSRWVAGGARSRDLAYEGPVDTVYLGAWPRETFARFGGFDEQLVRNQDDEHNLRIHKGGGRIWQSARIRSTYFPRGRIGDVFRQYRQYGYWKPFVMRKHGQPAAVRHLIPGLFVGLVAACCALTTLAVAALLWGVTTGHWAPGSGGAGYGLTLAAAYVGALGLLALVVAYGLAVGAVCVAVARRSGRDLLWHLPDVIGAYHVGYGLGSLRGWWDVLRGRPPDPAFGRLTR